MAMKQSSSGPMRIPREDEVEVIEALLTLPKLIAKSDFLSRYSFIWGRKKKRSVLDSKSESSPVTHHRQIDEDSPEKLTAAVKDDDADKSPSTPLCFLPDDKSKQQSLSLKKIIKRKVLLAADDLMEKYNGMQQENKILQRELKAMKALRQALGVQNLELKAKRQEVNYSKNMEDFRLWGSSSRTMNLDQQHFGHQITISSSSHNNSNNNGVGGRFGLFNQIDPRGKKIHHGETFDFMAASQPLDQSNYYVMDDDLRVRTAAAAARQRRIIRMKESKNSLLALKLSRACR
ncbi:hypothetical protein OSB04_017979 [Centaurea solstitialis]|uniref:Uncharacterized protein n=1 Tax=Centaurea solstitialis TaxID=347529 RepID=A0AA38T3X0_9ASTR|nr:hypothetical protein OSB04_017979 [Centaurea solstitialis]